MSTWEALIALFSILGVITVVAFIIKKLCDSNPASGTGKKIIAYFSIFFLIGCLFIKLSPRINPKGLSSDKLIDEKITESPLVDLIISRDFVYGYIHLSKIETILAFFCLIILLIILFIQVFKKQ